MPTGSSAGIHSHKGDATVSVGTSVAAGGSMGDGDIRTYDDGNCDGNDGVTVMNDENERTEVEKV